MLDSERVVQSDGAEDVEADVGPSYPPISPSLIGVYILISIEVNSSVEKGGGTYRYCY